MTRLAIIIAVVLLFISTAVYRVEQHQIAILLKLGEIVKDRVEPGLHFKWPLINNQATFDMRLQTLDSRPQRFLTLEKKDVIVDSFVKWRIRDVVRYYVSTGGNPEQAGMLLYQKINDGLRDEFGKRTVREVVSGERGTIMDIVTTTANERGEELGIQIVDVRLKRIDLPDEVSSNVYDRMRSERAQVARQWRAGGDKEAIRIQAEADKDREVILANANRDAETLRGEGDALATEIYGKAFGRDPEFYEFYRSLNAYRQSFNAGQDVMLLGPDSEFFKYFKESGGSP
ncbi:MAG: protease modulator HflC [Gammaproteobacteria bacterium]|nr:protease modulator HflC [Gammaproteobacteria bacterium]